MISVVVPMYNVEKYIDNTIASIDNQTYPCIEVIVVDDGSVDESVRLAKESLSKAKRICKWQVVERENHGVSAARNCGIELSRGDYCICLDSDDVLDSRALESMVSLFAKENVDVVISNFKSITDSDIPYSAPEGLSSVVFSRREALDAHFLRTKNMVAPALMFPGSLGVRYDENVRYAEDVVYVWDVLSCVQRVGYIETPLYGYRKRPGSTITAPDAGKMLSGLEGFKRLESRLSPGELRGDLVTDRFMLGALHALARASSRSAFLSAFESFDASSRMFALLGFPQLRVKILALIGIMSPNLLFSVLSSR